MEEVSGHRLVGGAGGGGGASLTVLTVSMDTTLKRRRKCEGSQ